MHKKTLDNVTCIIIAFENFKNILFGSNNDKSSYDLHSIRKGVNSINGDFKLKRNIKDGNKVPINFNITTNKVNDQNIELESKNYYNSYNLNEENLIELNEKGDKIDKRSKLIHLLCLNLNINLINWLNSV